jgi:hypothetical protein
MAFSWTTQESSYLRGGLMPDRVLLDTNILVYSRDEASPFFGQVCEALKGLVSEGVVLCIHQQILREYACVVTRPAPKGLGARIDRALKEIAEFEAFYRVLPDPEGVWPGSGSVW